ncbi:MAG: hypothetical protein ACLR6W_11295 [Evtepia sp.]
MLVCKLYWQDMDPTHFLDPGIDGKWYRTRIITGSIGEIVECLKKVVRMEYSGRSGNGGCMAEYDGSKSQ